MSIMQPLNKVKKTPRLLSALLPALRGSECEAASSRCRPEAGTSLSRHRPCWGWRLRRDCQSHRSPWPPALRSGPACIPERWGSSSKSSAPTKEAGTHLEGRKRHKFTILYLLVLHKYILYKYIKNRLLHYCSRVWNADKKGCTSVYYFCEQT